MGRCDKEVVIFVFLNSEATQRACSLDSIVECLTNLINKQALWRYSVLSSRMHDRASPLMSHFTIVGGEIVKTNLVLSHSDFYMNIHSILIYWYIHRTRDWSHRNCRAYFFPPLSCYHIEMNFLRCGAMSNLLNFFIQVRTTSIQRKSNSKVN